MHGVASQVNLKLTEEVKQGGLGVMTAAIFLAGEMAGSGVLALPAAMLGTGLKRGKGALYCYCVKMTVDRSLIVMYCTNYI